MRKQQIQKVYKQFSKSQLVHGVYTLGYDYDYTCELWEYSPQERILDYATNHAHDVANANNNIEELWECSKEYLYRNMIDLINGLNNLVDDWED
nr:MAG TPA: hypothetical protein [Caudoviricetes sp.]